MQATDFEYGEEFLHDFGFIVCDFNYSGGAVSTSGGSAIKFTKVSHHSGKRHSLAGTKYDECISTTFDICKDPDKFSEDEMIISDREYRDLFRWLNRRDFHRMRFIDDCKEDDEYVYYNASFNIEKITVAGDIVGMRLSMETDSPFGYGEQTTAEYECTGAEDLIEIVDWSDEIGVTPAVIDIVCGESGNMTITNSMSDFPIVIKNCAANEHIVIDGVHQIITSSMSSHNLAKDYNFEFFFIANSFAERTNYISCSIPCTVKISYSPTIKYTP